jgi:hypothetical protein
MRLKAIYKLTSPEDDTEALRVLFEQDDGVEGGLTLTLPAEWGEWDRGEKVAWGKAQIADYLANTNHVLPYEVIYPDLSASGAAKTDFEDLPGWASWTAAEAEAWIEDNVVNLASAKTALKAMAKAIVFLRNIVIEQ